MPWEIRGAPSQRGHGGRHAGFVRQEDFRLQDVLQNRFGKHYASTNGKEISAHVVVSGQAGHQRALHRR